MSVTMAEPDTIGSRLRSAREDAGATQQEIADAAGISWDQVSRYERGKSKPLYETVALIAAYLKRPISDFWPGPSSDRIQLPPPAPESKPMGKRK